MKENFLESFFKLKENKTTVRTEILAGLTTFVTLAYILAINPQILADAGMDKGSVFTATVLASLISTVVMALYANYPFVLSSGMGLNAFFAYIVVGKLGHTWQFALMAVFIEGIIFLLLTFLKVREAIVNAIPMNLKSAVAVGIGLFISLIGFKQSGIIVGNEATLVALGDLTSNGAIVTIVGLVLCISLLHFNVKGAILISVLVSTIVGIPLGITNLPSNIIGMPPSMKPTFMQFLTVPTQEIFSKDMLICVITFLFVDLFDTIGMLVGTAAKVELLDEKGNLPRAKEALTADAIGTTVGAMCGTSTITTFAESAAGVSEGGRTGLTALTSAALFFISLIFAPLFISIPPEATAPALIIVGLFMVENVKKIDFSKPEESFPAFLTMVLVPFSYSIGDGIMLGIVSFVIAKIVCGKAKEVSLVMYFLFVAFMWKIIFLT